MRTVSPVVRRSLLAAAVCSGILGAGAQAARISNPAIVTVYPVPHPRGVLATSGGWAYCLQTKALARRFDYTLVCGRYYLDGYTGYRLRSRRHLDWGDPAYLASLAARIAVVHASVGGDLVLLGVSYSGFGVATLASHHPELQPDRLIVIDSFLDLTARRAAAGPNRDRCGDRRRHGRIAGGPSGSDRERRGPRQARPDGDRADGDLEHRAG